MEVKSDGKKLHISLSVPLFMTGEYTYGEGEWKAPAVCVYINEKMDEFGLYHTQYLDYKDSLQATSPIAFFDSKEEALKVADEFNLSIEYSPTVSVL